MSESGQASSVVILGTKSDATNIIYNGLHKAVNVERVILEEKVERLTLVRRRVKRLGLRTVTGQILFMAIVQRSLARSSLRRVATIKRDHSLDDSPIPTSKRTHVSSVNSAETIAELHKLAPTVIVLCGTRILSKATLAATNATLINMHAGITPLYRGVHGGYWALAQNDSAHCGVTVHLVDAGIDTGMVLEQGLIEPTRDDNFATYPLLQIAVGLPLLVNAVSATLRGDLRPRPAPNQPSRLWSHPTLGQYVAHRLLHSVK